MKVETYFKKNGFVYGVSEKFEFGKWNGYAKKFDSMEDANKWLETDEHDFRIRSLTSETYVKENKYEVIE